MSSLNIPLLAGQGINAANSILGTLSNAKANKAYSKYAMQQSQSALSNFAQQANTIHTRYSQEQEAQTANQLSVYLENLQRKATAQASAAGSGVQGLSIDSLFNAYDRAVAISNYTAARNLKYKQMNYDDEIDSYRANAISAINSIKPYAGTSPLAATLDGFSNTMNLYSKNYKGTQGKAGEVFDTVKDWFKMRKYRKIDSNFTVG